MLSFSSCVPTPDPLEGIFRVSNNAVKIKKTDNNTKCCQGDTWQLLTLTRHQWKQGIQLFCHLLTSAKAESADDLQFYFKEYNQLHAPKRRPLPVKETNTSGSTSQLPPTAARSKFHTVLSPQMDLWWQSAAAFTSVPGCSELSVIEKLFTSWKVKDLYTFPCHTCLA